MLNAGNDKKLILVSAPAGYGKTALVSTWLNETGTRGAWLSLDAGDNDPLRFLQYMLGAIEAVVPAIGVDLLDILKSAQPGKYESVLDSLTNELALIPGRLVLVLDDFHLINSEDVVRFVLHLLEHLPEEKQLAIITRIDPPLPLSRMRARDQLVDIRSDQLRFSLQEAGVFLNDVMGLPLSAGDLSAMETRTEGWVAGLQLAGLSMQASPDVHSFVSAFSGSHHYVMDYLVEEALKLQPREVVSFLLQTSFLDQMCAPLCESVVGVEEGRASDARAMLEDLEARNLFVVPLDEERCWYRYHHLFADVLRKRLAHQSPHLVTELRRRASQWYEQNGMIGEAIQQAILANDRDLATRLTEDNGCTLMISGEVATLLGWIDAIAFNPEAHPWLAVQRGWALALTGNIDRVEQAIQVPEKLIAPLEPTPEVRTLRGTIAAARAYCAETLGDSKSAAQNARCALETLPDDNSISQSIRSVATSILGDASWINGNLDDAARAYIEAAHVSRQANNRHMIIIANSHLGDVLTEQGQFSRAADTYSQCLEMAVRPDGQRSPLAASVYAGIARISYEQNRLAEASQSIRLCIDLCRRWQDRGLQPVAFAMLARMELVRGNVEETRKAMRRAEQLADEYPLSPRQSILIESDLTRIWLAQGDLERLSQFIRKSGLAAESDAPYLRERQQIILLRLLLAQGDHSAALDLSKSLLETAEAARQTGRVIEVQVLRSLALQGGREVERALQVLRNALSLARPEGYVRTFIDEGDPMARLLHLARSRHSETEYVTKLLSAIEGTEGGTKPEPAPPGEPLTTREVEVLKLISAGCSNQEIAEKLVISIATVKRHISNLYTKLDVVSRTQAVAVAREMRLFE
jgi:LuxR family transcriptional regulator, maltose regulon positive regulatory protein